MRGERICHLQFLSITFKGKLHGILCLVEAFACEFSCIENTHVALFPDLTLQHLGAVEGFLAFFCTAEVEKHVVTHSAAPQLCVWLIRHSGICSSNSSGGLLASVRYWGAKLRRCFGSTAFQLQRLRPYRSGFWTSEQVP